MLSLFSVRSVDLVSMHVSESETQRVRPKCSMKGVRRTGSMSRAPIGGRGYVLYISRAVMLVITLWALG